MDQPWRTHSPVTAGSRLSPAAIWREDGFTMSEMHLPSPTVLFLVEQGPKPTKYCRPAPAPTLAHAQLNMARRTISAWSFFKSCNPSIFVISSANDAGPTEFRAIGRNSLFSDAPTRSHRHQLRKLRQNNFWSFWSGKSPSTSASILQSTPKSTQNRWRVLPSKFCSLKRFNPVCIPISSLHFSFTQRNSASCNR